MHVFIMTYDGLIDKQSLFSDLVAYQDISLALPCLALRFDRLFFSVLLAYCW